MSIRPYNLTLQTKGLLLHHKGSRIRTTDTSKIKFIRSFPTKYMTPTKMTRTVSRLYDHNENTFQISLFVPVKCVMDQYKKSVKLQTK